MSKMLRTVSVFLIPVFIVYTLLCLTAPTAGYAGTDKVTKFTPETAESDPIVAKGESSGISWWWYLLGAVAIGAAAAGGGGGGGGGSSGGGGTGTGVTVGW